MGFKKSGGECINEDECLLHPCQNGGRCRDYQPPRRYECSCNFGYAGQNCELELSASALLSPSFGFILTLIICSSSLIRKYIYFKIKKYHKFKC